MDRHSSYIFVWLQLELCAMAVLLTRGEGGETEPREGLAPAPGSPSPRRGGAGRARGGCN